MREFCSYLLLCFTIAKRGVREWVDVPATALGIALPLLAWRYPHFWNSEIGQLRMNALYWMVPCGLAWLYLSVRVLVSPYLVYKVERDRTSDLRSKLEQERANNNPSLKGEIDQVAFNPSACALFLGGSIGNTGSPSLAKSFRVFIQDGQVSARLPIAYMKKPFIVQFAGVPVGLHDLYEKASHVIQRGEEVRGFIMCPVNSEMWGAMKGPISIFLHFEDICGKQYVATNATPVYPGIEAVPTFVPGSGVIDPPLPDAQNSATG